MKSKENRENQVFLRAIGLLLLYEVFVLKPHFGYRV